MKIKLKESQLINILKKGIINESDDERFLNIIGNLAKLAADGKENETSSFNDLKNDLGVEFNPEFNPSNVDLSNFETIDIWPINNTKINSPFGPRNIGGNATKNHMGVDLYARSGTPIYSPANGVVVVAKNAKGKCGGLIRIDHGRYETKYCHCRRWSVEKGQEVIKGQLIGYTGGGERDPFKGNSMGAHLHYEVLVNGKHVDPQQVHSRLS